jgi:glycosyltransferase involved in cell wall biosynthesis
MPETSQNLSIVILNQYYVPDVASTGHLLHELAQALAESGHRVQVLTCRPSYGPRATWQPVPLREVRDGVTVRRLLTTRLSKDRLLGRLLNSMTFLMPLGVRVLLTSRPDRVYLYTTNPPFQGIVGAAVSLVRRHRYVLLLHDAYPQLAVWVGTLRAGGIIERVWHALNRITYRRAEQTIVLCHAAKELVCQTYGVDPARVHPIHNWGDGNELRPKPKRESTFAREQGLVDHFTLMYSGNLGLYYDFETILDAAEQLRDEDFRLVFIGSGGRRNWLAEQIRMRDLTNARLLPYQPRHVLPESLTACDAALATIAKGIEGISFPSKFYSSLAVGRPIVVLAEAHSELRHLVEEHDVGRWFNVGDGAGLARGIREMMQNPACLEEQGRNARALFEQQFTRQAAAARYADVLRRAAQPSAVPTVLSPQHDKAI